MEENQSQSKTGIYINVVAGFIIMALAFVAIQQHSLYKKNMDACEKALHELQLEVGKGKSVMAQLHEYEKKNSELSDRLLEVRVRVPEKINEEAFLQEVRNWTESHNVKLVSYNNELLEGSLGEFDMMFVVMNFEGKPSKLIKLMKSKYDMQRLVNWSRAGEHCEDKLRMVGIIYSLPSMSSRIDEEKYEIPEFPPSPWLPPFKDKADVIKSRIAEEYKQYEKVVEVRKELSRLKNLDEESKHNLKKISDLVEKVKGEQVDILHELKIQRCPRGHD